MKILVIGAGICGLFLSYYLLKAGHDVVLADVNKDNVRTSSYNAGQLSTRASFTNILANPAMLSPKIARQNPKWIRHAKAQTSVRYERVAHPLSVRSLELYQRFFRDEKPEVDVQAEVLDLHTKLPEDSELSPSGTFVGPKELGEIGYKGFEGGWRVEELSLHSGKLLEYLRARIEAQGGKFLRGETRLKKKGRAIGYALVGGARRKADAYAVAAGSWSNEVCRPLGYDPMVLPARGLALLYETRGDQVIDLPSHYEDERVTATQHDPNTLRFTSYFELVGFDPSFPSEKKERLFRTVTSHFSRPHKLELVEAGVGFRPSTPDQLPIVGKIPRCDNGYILTGATRKGMALAPLLGRMLMAMMTRHEEGDEMTRALDPGRFERQGPRRF